MTATDRLRALLDERGEHYETSGSKTWWGRPVDSRTGDLSEENEALRELVRDMYAVMTEDAANCDVTYPEQFDDRMRELGIEVGE